MGSAPSHRGSCFGESRAQTIKIGFQWQLSGIPYGIFLGLTFNNKVINNHIFFQIDYIFAI